GGRQVVPTEVIPQVTNPGKADRRHVRLVVAAKAAHRDILTPLEGAFERFPWGCGEAVPLPLLFLPAEEIEPLASEEPTENDEAHRWDQPEQDFREPAAEIPAVLLDEKHRQWRS